MHAREDPPIKYASRDAIEDVWGPRTPYKHEWPTRVDEMIVEEPEKWVQSACVLCRYVGLCLCVFETVLTCLFQ